MTKPSETHATAVMPTRGDPIVVTKKAIGILAVAGTLIVAGIAATADPGATRDARNPESRLAGVAAHDDPETFARETIAPILATHCLSCHGADAKTLRGGLQLDHRAALLRGGEMGAVIDLDDPERSLLLRAIDPSDDFLEMPPSGPLAEDERAAIARWVALGAPWPAELERAAHAALDDLEQRIDGAESTWWAWQPFHDVEVPSFEDDRSAAWLRNEIDAFILSGLRERGIEPAPEASRLELIRRATFDLTGLPPSPEEVDAFLADERPDAYERLVDRLLASPHHGERWGRHWLDVVRYAETNGFERDSVKPDVWRYRDWVVRAHNDDVPWNEFLLLQIAGDELPGRDVHTVAATGFQRLGLWDDEPTDVHQAQMDDLDSIVDTTARSMLGISLGCARCHDHKADPIAHEEYYAFASYFSNVLPYRRVGGGTHIAARHVTREMPARPGAPSQEQLLARFMNERETLAAQVRSIDERARIAFTPPVSGLVAHYAFEDERSRTLIDSIGSGDGDHPGTILDAGFGAEGVIGRAFAFDGGDDRIEIPRTITDDFTISFFFRTKALARGSARDPRWFQGTGLVDGEVPGIVRDFGISLIGPGVVAAGTGAPETFLHSPRGYHDDRWHHVALVRDAATGDVSLFLDGARVASRTGATGPLDAPDTLAIGAMRPGGGPFTGSIDELRLYDRPLEHDEIRALASHVSFDAVVEPLVASRLDADVAAARSRLLDRLRALRIERAEIVAVLAAREADVEADPMHVRIRGNAGALGAEVQPDVPAIVQRLAPATRPVGEIPPAIHGDSSGRRLALARWIADDDNALAARVGVNRIWQRHFVRGIVASPNDFGRLGLPPTHPELLEWLARRFVAEGWHPKAMHRLMMTSATYRMSSSPRADALARDPDNALWSRFPMRRLDAEEIRDAMLVASGEFRSTVGGPSVRPPMPREILETSSTPDAVWPVTDPADVGRRSLYVHVKRSLLDPLLTVFDLADVDSSCPERFATTQPTQALTMLNGAFVNERASRLAERLGREHPGDAEAQVVRGVRLTTGRTPDEEERAEALAFLRALEVEEGLDAADAMTTLCLVLLNTNEFLHAP